jgi:hypothetical protein
MPRWQIGAMTIGLNSACEMANWGNSKLEKWHVGSITSWLNGNLAKWQFVKMAVR